MNTHNRHLLIHRLLAIRLFFLLLSCWGPFPILNVVKTAEAAEKAVEIFWFDSRRSTPVSSKIALQSGNPYTIRIEGTSSLWTAQAWMQQGACASSESQPIFKSFDGVKNGQVGTDAVFHFAIPKSYDSTCKKNFPEWPSLKLSLNGGKTWGWLFSDRYNLKHVYEFTVIGQGHSVKLSHNDARFASDNYGRYKVSLFSAKTGSSNIPKPSLVRIPFASPGEADALHPSLKWSKGVGANSYRLLDDSGLKIRSGPETSQWGKATKAPLMTYPVSGNFTAQIKIVDILTSREKQSEVLGIRSSKDPTSWIRIAKEQHPNQPIRLYTEVNRHGQPSIPDWDKSPLAVNDFVYFRISREASLFTLSYSRDGKNWHVKDITWFSFPDEAEIFFGSYSWDSRYGNEATFYDFAVDEASVKRRDPDRNSGSNRSAEGATVIPLNGTDPQGRLDYAKGDRSDWYRVDLPEKGTFSYTIRQNSSGSTLFARFYHSPTAKLSSGKTPWKTISLKGGGLEVITLPDAEAGTYYAQVFVKNADDASSYEISNSFEATAPPPTPTPSGYTLKINSEPSGAFVYLGKKYWGVTPLTIPKIVGGSWSLRLEKTGYTSLETKIVLSSFNSKSLDYAFSYPLSPVATPTPTATPSPTPTPIPTPTAAATPTPIPLTALPPDLIQRPGKLYVVLIGTDSYQDPRISALPSVERDIQDLAETLTAVRYGALPQNQLKILLGEDVTTRNMKRTLGKWLQQRVNDDDTVFVFFRGQEDDEDDTAYWLTYDSEADDLFSSALSRAKLLDMLQRFTARNTLLVVQTDSSSQKIFPATFITEGRVLITAAGKRDITHSEKSKIQHSRFMPLLIAGLQGQADRSRDGTISLEEIWEFLSKEISSQPNAQIVLEKQGKLPEGLPLTFDVPFLLEQLSIETGKARITELYRSGDISRVQYNKAIALLEDGGSDQILQDFLAEKISLDIFREIF